MENKNNKKQTLRQAVARGKSFIDAYRESVRNETGSEAAQQVDALGAALCLVGRKPETAPTLLLDSDNGRQLDELLSTHATDNEADVPEMFRHLSRQLLGGDSADYQPQPAAPQPDEEQNRFLAYNMLVSQGVDPQEAERQVAQMYSPL